MVDLTRDRLEQLFEVDIEAGILIWRIRSADQFPSERACKSWNTRLAGQVAGSTNKRGYREIHFDGRLHLRHRLIWLAAHGVMPVEVDHVHGAAAGDGIGNLREATQGENMKNLAMQKRNKTGCIGVERLPSGKYRATIRSENKVHRLGHFNTLDEAVAVRKAAEREHGFHENHGRVA